MSNDSLGFEIDDFSMKMPFGKWKDNPISDIPNDYLKWVVEKTNASELLKLNIKARLRAYHLDEEDCKQ